MSLESNLELNNKLVAEQNGLLSQLLAALAGGKTFTADTPHQPKAETPVDKSATGKESRKGPFYAKHNGTEIAFRVDTWDEFEKANADSPYGGITEIHKVEFLQLKEHRASTEAKPVTLEDQPLPVAVALAVLYGDKGASSLTPEMMAGTVEIVETTDGKKRNEQIDALTMALKGVDRATQLHGAGVFDLALQMVEHWDALPSITERRAYADLLLDTPKEKRADVKPAKPKASAKGKKETVDTAEDPKALFAKAEQLILSLAKGGYRSEAVQILTDHGAKKLSEVEPDKLPAVIAAAEKALEA